MRDAGDAKEDCFADGRLELAGEAFIDDTSVRIERAPGDRFGELPEAIVHAGDLDLVRARGAVGFADRCGKLERRGRRESRLTLA